MNVIESIRNEPEKWTQTEHTFNHENGAQVWTSNLPIFDTNMYPSISMPFYQKIKLWMAVRWWSKNAPIEAFFW